MVIWVYLRKAPSNPLKWDEEKGSDILKLMISIGTQNEVTQNKSKSILKERLPFQDNNNINMIFKAVHHIIVCMHICTTNQKYYTF